MDSDEHKGWYSRGYLPHFDSPGLVQMIGFRLADSLPQHLQQKPTRDPELKNSQKGHDIIDDLLSNGYGECYLAKVEIARIMIDVLKGKDGVDYKLIAFAIMPNHVHVLVELFEDRLLPSIIKYWKGSSAYQANKRLNRTGSFWSRDYFDRYIRDDYHLNTAIEYIHMNPVKAGLVDKPELWRFSSAYDMKEQSKD